MKYEFSLTLFTSRSLCTLVHHTFFMGPPLYCTGLILTEHNFCNLLLVSLHSELHSFLKDIIQFTSVSYA